MKSDTSEIVPFVDLSIQNNIVCKEFIDDVHKIVTSSRFLLGDQLSEFELNYKNFTGAGAVVGVSNGTDALEISLRALDIPPDALICVPAFTFAATGIAVLRAGFRLTFCDVNRNTGLIDIESLSLLREKPDVVILVSLFGRSVDQEVVNWLNENQIIVIEDAAQAHGAKTSSGLRNSGLDLISTSFYPTKNLGCFGDGGAILVNNSKFLDRVMRLRNYGGLEKYEHETFGFNSRLSEIQCAILNQKLLHLTSWNEQRINAARLYLKNLSEVSEIEIPSMQFDESNVFHLFPIKILNRNMVKKEIEKRGVQVGIHYPKPLHFENLFKSKNISHGNLTNSEYWADANLTLPIYPGISTRQIDKVVNALKDSIYEVS